MADLGTWWKLWVSSLDDPDLDNLDIADFGRWAKFGAFVKSQGTSGGIVLTPPCRQLCSMFQVPDFEHLISTLERFPHASMRREISSVSGETVAAFQFDNWAKYQGDFSTHRVRQFREVKRSKRRGEEKRTEEKREEENTPPISPPAGKPDTTLQSAKEVLAWLNAKAGRSFRPSETNLALIRARLRDGIEPWQLRAIVSRKIREWGPDPKMVQYLRPATLFARGKCEQYLGQLPVAAPEQEGETHGRTV